MIGDVILAKGRHMGAIVQFGNRKAILRDGEWRCPDPVLEKHLNALTQAWVKETGGPRMDSQDPEHEAARLVAARSGGRLVLHTPPRGRRAHRVWLEHRQYRLNF
jgi:hypothetical protein